jgi:hypothetical protein
MNIIVICDDDQNTHAKKNRTFHLFYTHTHSQFIEEKSVELGGKKSLKKNKKQKRNSRCEGCRRYVGT